MTTALLKTNATYVLDDIYNDFIHIFDKITNYEMKTSVIDTSSGKQYMHSFKIDIPMRKDKNVANVCDICRVRITEVASPTPKNPDHCRITVEIQYINTTHLNNEVIVGTNRIGRYFQKFNTAFEKICKYLAANVSTYDIIRFYEENSDVAVYRNYSDMRKGF